MENDNINDVVIELKELEDQAKSTSGEISNLKMKLADLGIAFYNAGLRIDGVYDSLKKISDLSVQGNTQNSESSNENNDNIVIEKVKGNIIEGLIATIVKTIQANLPLIASSLGIGLGIGGIAIGSSITAALAAAWPALLALGIAIIGTIIIDKIYSYFKEKKNEKKEDSSQTNGSTAPNFPSRPFSMENSARVPV